MLKHRHERGGIQSYSAARCPFPVEWFYEGPCTILCHPTTCKHAQLSLPRPPQDVHGRARPICVDLLAVIGRTAPLWVDRVPPKRDADAGRIDGVVSAVEGGEAAVQRQLLLKAE